MPAFNEERTLGKVLERIARALGSIAYEVIVVDDGSTDETARVARRSAERDRRVRVLAHEVNRGKGAAVRTGLACAAGEVVAIQDADLELEPRDLARLFAVFDDPFVDVVYGSRWLDPSLVEVEGAARPVARRSRFAARVLSWLANRLYGSRISDEPCGYKLFRRSVLAGIELRARRFELCSELTAKLSSAGYRIHERAVAYRPRTAAEGKKIRLRDGLACAWALLRLRFAGARKRSRSRNGAGESVDG